jgi:nucleotide-binding universal stress UspA family protein
MNARKILFATDFSPTSAAALEVAATLAKERQAELLICYVEPPPVVYGGEEMMTHIAEFDTELARRKLETVRPVDAGVNVRHVLLLGPPARELADLAQSEQVELMVIGTHGRTGLARFVLGSVAEAVMRAAPCPVLTVKPSVVKPAVPEEREAVGAKSMPGSASTSE